MSSGKIALGRLPGEPKKKAKATHTLTHTGAPLTKLTAAEVKALMGTGSSSVVLDLSSSQFNLEDDKFLVMCTNTVKVLDMSSNSLMELSSLSHLSKLEELYADMNVINHVKFTGLTSLVLLSLKQNSIERLPDMSDMKKLVNIDLSRNKVSSGFDSLEDCRSLKVLDLSFNKMELPLFNFHNDVVSHLRKIPKLEYLSFEGNPIETSIPEFRSYIAFEFPKLKYLDWVQITKEERQKGVMLEKQKVWDAKNFPPPVPSNPPPAARKSSKTASSGKPSSSASGNSASTDDICATSLEGLLADIDDLLHPSQKQPTTPQKIDVPPPGSLSPQQGSTPKTPETPIPPPSSEPAVSRGDNIDGFLALLDSMTVEDEGIPPPADDSKPVTPDQTTSSLVDMITEMLSPVEDNPPPFEPPKDREPEGTGKFPPPQQMTKSMVNHTLDDLLESISNFGQTDINSIPNVDDIEIPPPPVEPETAHSPKLGAPPTPTIPAPDVEPQLPPPPPVPVEQEPTLPPPPPVPVEQEPTLPPPPPVPAEAEPRVPPAVVNEPTRKGPSPQLSKSPRHQQPKAKAVTITMDELNQMDLLHATPEPAAEKDVPPPQPAATSPSEGRVTPSAVLAQIAASTQPPAEPWMIRYGDYTPQYGLGEGSLGDLHCSIDSNGVACTMKIIRPQRFHPSFVSEFSSEFQRMYNLPQHPNVVHVSGASIEHTIAYSCPFLCGPDVSEYAHGLDNFQCFPERLEIARGIVQGMIFLHQNNIVHGSLKPRDVVLDERLTPKIRDYGFIKIKQMNLRDGALFSPEFMAPELFTSNFEQITAASDVYSFGVILWLLFEGKLDGKCFNADHQIGEPLDIVFEGTPNSIASIVRLCTSKQPEYRPKFEDVLQLLMATPPDSLLQFDANANDAATLARKQKQAAVAAKMNDLFSIEGNDEVTCKAIDGVLALGRMEANRAVVWEHGLHLQLLKCLLGGHETVMERTLRTMIELMQFKEFANAMLKVMSPELIISVLECRNNVLIGFLLRFMGKIMDYEEGRQMMYSSGVATRLCEFLHSHDDIVLANVTFACARFMKFPPAREQIFLNGGLNSLLLLLRNNHPAILLNTLTALSLLALYPPAQDQIVVDDVPRRVRNLMCQKGELIQVQCLRCASHFSSDPQLAAKLQPLQWVVDLQFFLRPENLRDIHTANPVILKNLFRSLRQFAVDQNVIAKLHNCQVMDRVLTILRPMRLDNKKLQSAFVEAVRLLDAMVRGSLPSRDFFVQRDGPRIVARILADNCHVPRLQTVCSDLLSSAMVGEPSVIMQLSGAAVVPGILRQVFASASRGNQDQLLSALRFVRVMGQNASQSPKNSDSIIQLVLDCGVVEKLVNMLVSCPSSLPDSDTVQHNCALCLITLLPFSAVQNVMKNVKGSYNALFSVFRAKNEANLQELLGAFIPILNCPGVGDVCVDNGLLVTLPAIVVHDSVTIQSVSLKIVVSLIKVLTNKQVLRNQTLLSSLSRVSSSSSNNAVSATAAKIMSIINNL